MRLELRDGREGRGGHLGERALRWAFRCWCVGGAGLVHRQGFIYCGVLLFIGLAPKLFVCGFLYSKACLTFCSGGRRVCSKSYDTAPAAPKKPCLSF